MKEYQDNEMSIMEHLEELRERILWILITFFTTSGICLFYTDNISHILQQPAAGIKFLQLAPGEYLFACIKIAIYSGFLFSCPFGIYQIIQFILPGLTLQESSYIIPLLSGSIILFFGGVLFAYQILAPAALGFLMQYGSEIIEPLWSFEEYLNFISILLFSTGITFQIPIIQIILGIFNIVSYQKMAKYWKYVIFMSTIIGAILTPSTDPITQIIMTLAIVGLYFIGIIILKIFQ
uniref:Sec-independent protein translocase component TatC n=1 Tax=Spyridia filamentosa TaxID=196632 RepID=A0A1Z1MJG5_SPYFI|nr:Sec-independent protein translocase component TatC [Spyridia filamentosa]ARW66220.1 Sec-independent protein translocase component TatC [Spyridia filamentosa]